LFPSIGYASCYSRQIPWFIEKSISEIANEIKSKFDILIISPTNPQVRSIAHSLQEKGFVNIDFPEEPNEREITLLEGYKMLIENEEDNLGWRIISSFKLQADKLSELIVKSIEYPSNMIFKYLSTDLVKEILDTKRTLLKILQNKPVNPELLASTFKEFRIDPEHISSHYLFKKTEALNPPFGNPAIRNIPVKITTIQSAKGLAADVVFIVNFDDRFFLRDGSNIADQDVCNFLVSLTRTKKKAFLISSVVGKTPTLLKWIAKERIELLR
jgi:superfamily I DNA/RNA helicase